MLAHGEDRHILYSFISDLPEFKKSIYLTEFSEKSKLEFFKNSSKYRDGVVFNNFITKTADLCEKIG